MLNLIQPDCAISTKHRMHVWLKKYKKRVTVSFNTIFSLFSSHRKFAWNYKLNFFEGTHFLYRFFI